MTSASAFAAVVDIDTDKDEVVLEVAPGVHSRYVRRAIVNVVPAEEPSVADLVDDAPTHRQCRPRARTAPTATTTAEGSGISRGSPAIASDLVTYMPAIADSDRDLLLSRIRDVPDWPEPGVMFKDITPLLRDPAAFDTMIKLLSAVGGQEVDVVVGIEARGFILGSPVALPASGPASSPSARQGKRCPTRSTAEQLRPRVRRAPPSRCTPTPSSAGGAGPDRRRRARHRRRCARRSTSCVPPAPTWWASASSWSSAS